MLPGSALDIKFQEECSTSETVSCIHICEKLDSLFSLRKVRGDIGLGVNVGVTHQDSVHPPCRLCGGQSMKNCADISQTFKLSPEPGEVLM